MERTISKRQIEEYRKRLWRLKRGARLPTMDKAADFVDEVGMCLLFACKDIPLPKLHDCGPADFEWWAWKDLLQEEKRVYNGRLVRRKATLVSMRLLPAFLAVYLTGGGYFTYEEEYYWGKLGQLANEVAEYLDRNGPTPVDDLRRAIMPSGKANTRRFHSAIFELQSKFKIVSVGLEDKSWGVRVLDLFLNWVPAKVERAAENMDREEALQKICAVFMSTAGAIPERVLPRMFGWPASETSAIVNAMVENGLLEHGRIRGDKNKYLVCPDI